MRFSRTAVGTAVMVAAVGMTGCSAEAPETAATPAAPGTAAPETPAPEAADSVYTDGEYSATGWYGGLPSHHDVTLTIADDIVTAVEITTPAEDETSLGYQQQFAAALPDAIVGQSVDDLAVDRLAGSSGCSEGFMDALAQIKTQASEGTP
ncbi:uncharacterized protein with FMN-binding domain [Conyzicola lurida]|uniref:Uncharacterized protein with FMN-binding domain n=1 Tax=Conyzicola lurida TaxID=1172621 RepID=A0A841ASW1_9MICO|nr:calcium-binding protein [Conyzicola lurida]MBB5844665.1 uncharacterized protein with FMN-binding domain [Conyzicola lurida]